VTTPRRLLVRSLFEAAGHRTAEELTAEIQSHAPDVSISTVYRNLEELERLGVVVHAHLGHGPATYHLATAAHGHLVCERCATHVEVAEGFFADLRRRAFAEFGFVIDPRHFAVVGLCAACQADTEDFGDITGS
jgi:Fur family ferric uptake transcriptional regulator